MPLSPPPPCSDWILVYVFALSSLIFFLFCHFYLQIHRTIHISAPLITPPIKEAIQSVSQMEPPHSNSPISSPRSEKSRVSDCDLIHVESDDSDTNVTCSSVEHSLPIIDRRNYSDLGFVEQEQEQQEEQQEEDDQFDATSVKVSQVEVVEEQVLKFSDGDLESVISDLKSNVVFKHVDSESKGVTEDRDEVTSVCGVLQPEEPEFEGIMEDCYLKTSVFNNCGGVLQPESEGVMEDCYLKTSVFNNCGGVLQPESEGIMEDCYLKTSVFSHNQTSQPESSGIMEDYNVDSQFLASDFKNISRLLPDSQSTASDLEEITELHHDSPSMDSDVKNFSELLHNDAPIASDLEKISELHPQPTSIVSDLKIFTELHTSPPYPASDLEDFTELHPPSMACDMENFIAEELKFIKEEQFQSSNGHENSEDGFKHSVAEEIDEHKVVEAEEKNQSLNYIAQVGREEILVSKEEQSHGAEGADDKEIQIPQPTKYKISKDT